MDLLNLLEDLKAHIFEVGKMQKDSLGREDLQIETKSTDRDLVTEIDRLSETMIKDWIRARYPEHSFLAEESGSEDHGKEYKWIIDPLDGTTNYAQGMPIFSISVALQKKGETVLGIVYAPYLGEMFTAVKGQGAYLNQKPLQVGKKKELKDSVVCTGFPYDKFINPDNNIDYLEKMIVNSRGIRRLGSAAYDLCNTAMGRYDGYWEIAIKPWDVAAGILLVQEAGGIVKPIPGKRDISLVAGNEIIVDKILHIFAES